ncbi:hypothetical protein GGX14DRAFT_571946 [Mycena pura]|uniref:Uncharacterized protein n=1 Tax=Mycena pura TaxID=153505 RepID=A0AAD6V977_9AGAR|nr:hypothetical protein GGX14DRAFT_571946 [Mycena pura]
MIVNCFHTNHLVCAHSPPAARRPPPAARCPLPAARRPLPAACRQPPHIPLFSRPAAQLPAAPPLSQPPASLAARCSALATCCVSPSLVPCISSLAEADLAPLLAAAAAIVDEVIYLYEGTVYSAAKSSMALATSAAVLPDMCRAVIPAGAHVMRTAASITTAGATTQNSYLRFANICLLSLAPLNAPPLMPAACFLPALRVTRGYTRFGTHIELHKAGLLHIFIPSSHPSSSPPCSWDTEIILLGHRGSLLRTAVCLAFHDAGTFSLCFTALGLPNGTAAGSFLWDPDECCSGSVLQLAGVLGAITCPSSETVMAEYLPASSSVPALRPANKN